MKFEIKNFYRRKFKDTAGEHTEYFYCADIMNANEGTQYKPFYIIVLVSIAGKGIEIESNEKGETDARGYEKISKKEFAKILLEETTSGKTFLAEAIREYNLAKKEKAEERAAANFPDFGFGNE